MPELSTPIKFVKRVGERVAVELAKRGVETVEDLLYHLPFRYEDRLNPVPMSALQAGTMASVIGEVRGSVLLQTRRMPLFEVTVGQGLSSVKCMWFRGGYLRDKFRLGQMVALYGKLEASRSSAGKFKMIQPEWEILPGRGSRTLSSPCWRWGGSFRVRNAGRDDGVGGEAGIEVAAARDLGLVRGAWEPSSEWRSSRAVLETLPAALCGRLGTAGPVGGSAGGAIS